MAEYAFTLVSAICADLHTTMRVQYERRWVHRETTRLAGREVLVAGAGGIGRAIARMLHRLAAPSAISGTRASSCAVRGAVGRGCGHGGRVRRGAVWRAGAVIAAGLAVAGLAACQAPARARVSPQRPGPVTSPPVPAGAAPVAASPPPSRPTGNVPGRWHLVFSAVFTGRELSTARWSKGWLAPGITSPVDRQELECYAPRNVTVASGALNLSLTRQPHSCGGKARPYTSGLVNTDGKFQFSYGFMQARIWLPGRGGRIVNWPAFWADGQNWPEDGEIDVLEGLGGKACWHFVNPATVRGGCAAGTFGNGWHTFGADWEPRSITYYYDGRAVGTIKSGITHAPMYLILNNATAHLYQIPLHVPADMRVAYVRVWQHPRR